MKTYGSKQPSKVGLLLSLLSSLHPGPYGNDPGLYKGDLDGVAYWELHHGLSQCPPCEVLYAVLGWMLIGHLTGHWS